MLHYALGAVSNNELARAVLHLLPMRLPAIRHELLYRHPDLSRLEDRHCWHRASSHLDDLGADELARHCRGTVLEDHRDDFLEVVVEFFESLALGVRTWESRDVADKEPGVGAALDNSSEVPHRHDLGLALGDRL